MPAGWIEGRVRGIEIEIAFRSQLPLITPPTPAPIIHIADWHWVPEGQHGEGDYQAFLEQVDAVQRRQMAMIRLWGVREVWVEGQSDETIGDFLQHIQLLKTVELPKDDSPASQFVRDEYREDLLQIGAAGRLLLAGDIDETHPAEDHDAWTAAKPVDGVIDPAANERQPGAVIILGAKHDLRKWIADSIRYRIERVDTLPE